MYGIEHNEEVGRLALEWTGRYDQIHIILGDALAHDYNPYTVLSLVRSLLKKTFCDCVEHLEATMTHPIRLVFWYGQEYYCDLPGRPGWSKLKEARAKRVFGIRVGNHYSIWRFDPAARREHSGQKEV